MKKKIFFITFNVRAVSSRFISLLNWVCIPIKVNCVVIVR